MKKFFESIFFITFAVLWTFAESALSLLNLSLSAWILRMLLGIILAISISLHFYYKIKNKKTCYLHQDKKIDKKIKNAIKKSVKYLEENNQNIHGQRYRHIPSLMESSTVIGAIYLASNTLNSKPQVKLETLTWLTNSLKKALIENEKVKYLDCAKCMNYKSCNIKYFDYLSHYYYAKNTILEEQLHTNFSFIVNILEQKFIEKNSMGGWPLFDGDELIDPLSTSTNLILLSLYSTFSADKIKSSIEYLINNQTKSGNFSGSWTRSNNDFNNTDFACARDFKLITTHRAIEALSIYAPLFSKEKNIELAIQKGLQFLQNSSLLEKSVSYEYDFGISEPEALRGIGHILQAFIKVNRFDYSNTSQNILINYLLNSQNPNGSYIGSSDLLSYDRDLLSNTDLTAFITRTLCLYYKEYKKDIK